MQLITSMKYFRFHNKNVRLFTNIIKILRETLLETVFCFCFMSAFMSKKPSLLYYFRFSRIRKISHKFKKCIRRKTDITKDNPMKVWCLMFSLINKHGNIATIYRS